jgi:hypothetical protein
MRPDCGGRDRPAGCPTRGRGRARDDANPVRARYTGSCETGSRLLIRASPKQRKLIIWFCCHAFKGVRRMRAAAEQRFDPTQSPAAVATIARVSPRPAAQSREKSPTRVADREDTDHRLRADYGARNDATQRPRTSPNILPETTVFLVIFAFIVGMSFFVAPRILNPGTNTPPTRVGTYPSSNFSLCSVQAWSGLRSDVCALPLPRMGYGSHECC